VSDDNSRPVLEFDDVWLPLREEEGGVAIDLTLHAGDFILVQPGDEQHERALVDAACGLASPGKGAVRFLGHAWPDLPADQANALRGRIGHVFRHGAWISYLSLLDNILLPQLYHTRVGYAELRAEASRLAAWFGLPGLPTGRPDATGPADLQRAAYVRAFLGSPALIILEGAAGNLSGGLLSPLINAMRAARDRDAAIFWLGQSPEVFHDSTIPATRRLRLRRHAIEPMEAVA
jgi:phospholipid/cholesterol/gamma-HCH transport system ATP-binding protein